ncbi:hypothetical protein ACLMJK_000792 [Lecanora helva]
MKLAYVTVIGAISAISAIPTSTSPCAPDETTRSCPTKTIPNVIANFDDVPAHFPLPTPYHYLHYANLTVSPALPKLIPPSLPNYGLSGPYADLYAVKPHLSIDDTPSTSFDLHNVYVGCVSAKNHTPIACRPYIQCATPIGMEGNEGPLQPQYKPNSAGGGSTLLHVQVGFTYLTYCDFRVVESALAFPETLLLTDGFNYTIREGERGFCCA